MYEDQILNPFGFGIVTKVINENRKPIEWYWDYLEFAEIVSENEFYVLFSDGLLVTKGRSKFTTSQYIKGEKYIPFKKVYSNLGV